MESSKLLQWLNILTGIGVLVGLVFVALEIRQTNVIAFAEARGELLADYQQQAMSNYGPEIADLFIKSVEEPEQLSDAEIFKLNAYLVAVMSVLNKQAVLYYDFGWAAEPSDDILDNARFYFGGHFARSWWQENKYWMDPNLVELFDQHIAENPASNRWEYGDFIRSRIPSETNEKVN